MYQHPDIPANRVTLEAYFQGYASHPEITPDIEAEAESWCSSVNRLLELAEAAGVPLRRNPVTGTLISGEKNGGWRPSRCKVGAKNSRHKTGQGGDLYDPDRLLASWLVADEGRAALVECGLWAERVEWTPTWVHLQIVAPGNPPRPEALFFIPDASPARASLPTRWAIVKAQLEAAA